MYVKPARHTALSKITMGKPFSLDTARGYGESERIVGQVVREHRGDPLYVEGALVATPFDRNIGITDDHAPRGRNHDVTLE